MVKISQAREVDDCISFDDDTDILKRKSFWEWLANLIINSENESLVISINAKWGEWKTDFLKRWNNYLKNDRELNTIYFNSFKNDYIEDPFIALLGEVSNVFSDKGIKEKIKEKWKNILKWILPLAWKVWVRWIMKWDSEQISNDWENLLEWDIANEVWKKLESYSNKESEILDFRKTLEEVIEAERKQLVFIIDELDRCRPDFALRLLERIKHFFDIKGLYFVLGINKEQIEKYIEKIYWNIDSTVYLQKFIDIETILPKEINEIGWDMKKYIDYLFVKNDGIFNKKKDSIWIEFLGNLLLFISEKYSLTLRQIEKIFNDLIIFRKIKWERLYFIKTVLIIIFIKCFDNNLYRVMREWKSKKEDLLEFLDLSNISDDKKLNEEIDFIYDEELSPEISVKYYNRYWYDTSYEWRKKLLKYHFDMLENFNI